MTRPVVVAHAGGSAHAPANTFGAYRRAHATYPDVWMEFDAQFSADSELMAIHDDTLDRTTDATGPVSDLTSDQLQECNAAATFDGWGFESIPRVRELFEEGADAGWNLVAEIKNIPGQSQFDATGERYAEALDLILKDTKFPLDRLVVICFWGPTLDAVKARNGDIALGFLSVPELPRGRGFTAAENAALCKERGYQVCSVVHTTPDLTKEVVAASREMGIQTHVWTPNSVEDIEAAVAKDLDGITSDYPDRILTALGR